MRYNNKRIENKNKNSSISHHTTHRLETDKKKKSNRSSGPEGKRRKLGLPAFIFISNILAVKLQKSASSPMVNVTMQC